MFECEVILNIVKNYQFLCTKCVMFVLVHKMFCKVYTQGVYSWEP